MSKIIKGLTQLGIVVFVVVNICYSQDIIVFRNGDEIKGKVLEVGTNEIKYKKWENLEGPTYASTKGEVFMIKYQNGAKDVFNNPANDSKPKTEDKSSAPSSTTSRPEVSDTSAECKTYLSFTNKTQKRLVVKLKTGKKTKDRWENNIDETIDFPLSPGKSKKIKVDESGTYKYRVIEESRGFITDHSEGIVEAEECKTVNEEIE